MSVVLIVPSWGGTQLGRKPGGDDPVWVSYPELAMANVRQLRLGPDGVSPGPPDGVALFPGEPLQAYYQTAVVALTAQLKPLGFVVKTHGYDWRLDARTTGRELADRIRANASPEEPATVVAHSWGGIVARLAWRELVLTGEQALLRRLICLGTPHWGSYAPIEALSLTGQWSRQIQAISLGGQLLNVRTPADRLTFFPTAAQIATLASSFPSVYQLFPSLVAPNAASDPYRSALFGDTWPTDRGLDLGRIAETAMVFHPLLTRAETVPPPWVLTSAAAQGLPTTSRLLFPSLLGAANALGQSDSGDGTVTTDSAWLAGSALKAVTAAHADMANVLALGGQLADWILDPRGPPSPAPPLQTVGGNLTVVLQGPPLPSGLPSKPFVSSDC